jgi:SAM-dependent methyltransferase
MNDLTHPGGFEITKRAFNICGLPRGANILDIGCGCGDTAAYLKDEYDFSVTGIDKSAQAVSQAKQKHPGLEFMEGDGQWLDFESLSFDCVLMECTLSLMPNPVEAIHEAFCVLKEDGYLIMHDLYLPHPSEEDLEVIEHIKKSKAEHKDGGSCCEECPSACTVNGALVLKDIDAALDELGFEVVLFEDRKTDLDSFAVSLIFNGVGIDGCLGAKRGANRSKLSYYLMIARKVKK